MSSQFECHVDLIKNSTVLWLKKLCICINCQLVKTLDRVLDLSPDHDLNLQNRKQILLKAKTFPVWNAKNPVILERKLRKMTLSLDLSLSVSLSLSLSLLMGFYSLILGFNSWIYGHYGKRESALRKQFTNSYLLLLSSFPMTFLYFSEWNFLSSFSPLYRSVSRSVRHASVIRHTFTSSVFQSLFPFCVSPFVGLSSFIGKKS